MAAPAITVLLYRMRNPNGTSKDWAVPTVLDPQRLTVYFGRTGSTLRQAETPAGQCRDGIPIREAEKRIREKMAKGYQALGTFRLAANRRDLSLASTSPPDAGHGRDTPETSNAVPALYWRLHAPATVTGTRFETAVQDTNERLATVGWSLPGSRPDDAGRALWLRAIGPPASSHGLVPLTDDRRPLIAFFLLLARREVGLSLADDSGQAVTAWPAELPVEAAILETLGLRPKDLNQWLASTNGDDWFF